MFLRQCFLERSLVALLERRFFLPELRSVLLGQHRFDLLGLHKSVLLGQMSVLLGQMFALLENRLLQLQLGYCYKLLVELYSKLVGQCIHCWWQFQQQGCMM